VDPNDWKMTAGRPSFLEDEIVKGRPSVGVAFSGGGTRSATATLGALRGMKQNGWLDHVRFVSAVSGGAWTAIPFTFSALDLDELLGSIENLQESAFSADVFLKTPNGQMAKAIADSSLAATASLEAAAIAAQANANKSKLLLAAFLQLTRQLRRDPDRIDKTYTRLIGKAFIDPLIEPGASTSNRFFTWDLSALKAMPEASVVKLGDFVMAHTERPFLIASATMVLESPSEESFPDLMPVEYTPLYVGVRQKFDKFGGGYVYPWAYDPPSGVVNVKPDAAQGGGLFDIHFDPAHRFTLADVAASTGAAPELLTITGGPVPEDYRSYVQEGAQVFPHFRHISVQSVDTVETSEAALAHADGGASDNLGVMPLLARQTKNILMFVNTNNRWFATNDDLRSLFIPIGPPTSEGDKRYNAVFESKVAGVDAYTQMITAFDREHDAGRPLVFCATDWKVKPNEHYNIRGYDDVRVCVIYNASVPTWFDTLRNQPRLIEAVNAAKNFPWFATFEQNKPHVIQLKPAQINLLANLWAWTMTEPMVVRLIHTAMPDLPCPASAKCES
jgi:hypothetical protein